MSRRDTINRHAARFVAPLGGVVLTATAYLAVSRYAGPAVEAFFMARGVFQPVSLFLFFYAVAVLALEWRRLGRELAASVPLPSAAPVGPADAERFLSSRAAAAGSLASVLWFRLLRAYARFEDPRAAADRLLAGAEAGIRRGGRVLLSVRGILPLVGLVGTVLGLSRGMWRFASIASAAGSSVDLHTLLLAFAASMSQAFDTTLLAIILAMLLWLCAPLLRGREDALLAHIESGLRRTVDSLQPLGSEARLGAAVASTLTDFSNALARALNETASAVFAEIRGQIRGDLSAFSERLLIAWSTELTDISTSIFETASAHQTAVADRVTGAIAEHGRIVVEKIAALEGGVRELRPTQLRIVADYPELEARNGAAAR